MQASRWRVRWADGGGRGAARALPAQNLTRRYPTLLRSADARQGHGPVRTTLVLGYAAYAACPVRLRLRRAHVGDRVPTVRRPTAVTGSSIKLSRRPHEAGSSGGSVPEPVWRRFHAELPPTRTPWCSRRKWADSRLSVNTAGHSTTPATRSGSRLVPHALKTPRPSLAISAGANVKVVTASDTRQRGDDVDRPSAQRRPAVADAL